MDGEQSGKERCWPVAGSGWFFLEHPLVSAKAPSLKAVANELRLGSARATEGSPGESPSGWLGQPDQREPSHPRHPYPPHPGSPSPTVS